MLKTVGFPSTRTGDQTIVNGNLVIGTSGKGIDFSATAGTGTSELLADYEEGTWTPAYDSTGATFGYSIQYGSYVKVGNMVKAQFRLRANSVTGTTTNPVNISGLPFTSANLNTYYQEGSALGLQTFVSVLSADVSNNVTTMNLWITGSTGQPTAINALNAFLNGTAIYQSA
jgi:hypothetical protein